MVSFHIWGEHQSKTGLSKRNNRDAEKLFYRKLGLKKLVCRRVRIENLGYTAHSKFQEVPLPSTLEEKNLLFALFFNSPYS